MAKDEFTFDDLRSALVRQKAAPVYLLCGEEDFLIDEATDLVVASALASEQHDFNLDTMYGSDADAREILSHASSFPMMSERRVVIVRDFDKLGGKEILSSYIERPVLSTCLVLQSVKPDFRKKPYLTAKRYATVIKCDPVREYQIGAWIRNRVKDQGFEIEAGAVKILATYVGTSLREIQNELTKLYIFIGGRRTITSDDIRAVVGVSKEYNVFELQNALGTRDIARSTEILVRMIDAGESPVLVIVMLTRYFTTLWKLHDHKRKGMSNGELPGLVGVNPYFLKDYISSANNYPPADIENAFELLAMADLELKSSSVDALQVMQNMLLLIMKRNEGVMA